MTSPDFTFIDLFAGIGGIRIAFERAGGRCVMTSEWDRFAQKTYQAQFQDGEDHLSVGDITQLPEAADSPEELALTALAADAVTVPNHDILVGGFPCQPFSIAGVSKKNALGRKHGFEDETQGTLFFNLKNLLLNKRPRAFLLENVKNLKSHDRGNTWRVIEKTLRDIGYVFSAKVIDARDTSPQHRERVFIVGFDREAVGLEGLKDTDKNWAPFWEQVSTELALEREREAAIYGSPSDGWPRVGAILETRPDARYTLSEKLWSYLQGYKAKHQAAGNGFGFGLVNEESPYARTLSARYYKDGSEVLIEQGRGKRPRRLTPLECARLQGFPQEFQRLYESRETQPVSDTQAYKQFGNSVCVPVVTAVARVLVEWMQSPGRLKATESAPSAAQHASA
jgi:DNA (cytosine-5)-methyltransferase 1